MALEDSINGALRKSIQQLMDLSFLHALARISCVGPYPVGRTNNMASISNVAHQNDSIGSFTSQSRTLSFNYLCVAAEFNPWDLLIAQAPTWRTSRSELCRQPNGPNLDPVSESVKFGKLLLWKYKIIPLFVLKICGQIYSIPCTQKLLEKVIAIIEVMISNSSSIDFHVIHKGVDDFPSC